MIEPSLRSSVGNLSRSGLELSTFCFSFGSVSLSEAFVTVSSTLHVAKNRHDKVETLAFLGSIRAHICFYAFMRSTWIIYSLIKLGNFYSQLPKGVVTPSTTLYEINSGHLITRISR